MRRVVILAALLAVGCGGGEQQGADEPEGEFKVEVVSASLPRLQHIGEDVELKVRVRNADDETLRNVAVTVETQPNGANAPAAFGQSDVLAGQADSTRPIWVLGEGPAGGDTAYVNTWLAGTLRAGEERELTWSLVPSRAGTYVLDYRVAPGLTGKARAARGKTNGTLRVRISDEPAPARVDDDGEVVRAEPGAG